MQFSSEQNHYPNVSFITRNKEKIVLDLKSTYRAKDDEVPGFTLGAFSRHFRDRDSCKNITYPYNGIYVVYVGEDD
jgi:hypothetical protein